MQLLTRKPLHGRGRKVDFGESAMSALEAYDDPKNVRELDSGVRTAITNMGSVSHLIPRLHRQLRDPLWREQTANAA